MNRWNLFSNKHDQLKSACNREQTSLVLEYKANMLELPFTTTNV